MMREHRLARDRANLGRVARVYTVYAEGHGFNSDKLEARCKGKAQSANYFASKAGYDWEAAQPLKEDGSESPARAGQGKAIAEANLIILPQGGVTGRRGVRS